MSQFDNPYAPPEADDLEPQAFAGELVIGASQGKRFVNFFVDTIASRIVSIPISVLAAKGADSGAAAVAGILAIVLVFGYYVFFELAFQATLGKLLTGTRVVSLDGQKPRFTQILGRTLSRFVPFEPFSFFSGGRPVGWHDKWSNTRVVEKNRVRS